MIDHLSLGVAALARPAHGPGYRAAFVRDLDGPRLEAVWHEARVSPGLSLLAAD